MQAPWRHLIGPARALAISATILLIASALGGIEAAVMMILGPARDIVIKPFVLAGYVEACAMFFSLLGVVISIICLMFYRPYLYFREKMFFYRARRAAPVSDEHTWFEPIQHPHGRDPEEDGSPD